MIATDQSITKNRKPLINALNNTCVLRNELKIEYGTQKDSSSNIYYLVGKTLNFLINELNGDWIVLEWIVLCFYTKLRLYFSYDSITLNLSLIDNNKSFKAKNEKSINQGFDIQYFNSTPNKFTFSCQTPFG